MILDGSKHGGVLTTLLQIMYGSSVHFLDFVSQNLQQFQHSDLLAR